jgi:glucosylceramidase
MARRHVIALVAGVLAVAVGALALDLASGRSAGDPGSAVASRRHGAAPVGRSTTSTTRPLRHVPPDEPPTATATVTTADRAELLHVEAPIPIVTTTEATAATGDRTGATIEVDPTERSQTVDGVGAALTDSTAQVLAAHLSPSSRRALLRDLFGADGAHLGVVRIPLSATDFASTDYTADDLPPGYTDRTLEHVSIAHDEEAIIPLLREALAVNPDLQVIASEWSPPGWMKVGNRATHRGLIGGKLRPGYEGVLGRYLARIVELYADDGITIDAATVQNEPTYSPADYPSMLMTPAQEAKVATAAGQALRASGLRTAVLVHDDNWDVARRVAPILDDAAAEPYIEGVAFHCYKGSPSAQAAVHDAHPDKDIYLTECTGTFDGHDFGTNLLRDVGDLLIGATRNWARSVMLWNMALDEVGRPHRGGCYACRGVVTVDSGSGEIGRNEEYYALAQFARGIDAGAVRVASTAESAGVQSVAFVNPDRSRAVLLANRSGDDVATTVHEGRRSFTYVLPARSVATVTWPAGP